MGAGAEGAAGVDDDVDRPLPRLLPGGPQPEALADQHRLVEVLPAVGPVVGDLGRDDLDQPVARRRLDLAQLGQLALAAVDRVLDVARPALLLDPVGRQHGQLGEDDLGLLGPAADHRRGGSTEGAAHAREEALLLAAGGAQVAGLERLARAFRASSAAPRRGRWGRSRGRRAPCRRAGPPFDPGSPCPRSAYWVPCWVPGGSSISRSPSCVGTLTLVAQHRVDRGDLDRVDQVLPAHRPAPHSKPIRWPLKKAWKMSSTEPKPAPGAKPLPRSPSWP